MARNQKLTNILQGRTIVSAQTEGNTLVLLLSDGSRLSIRIAGDCPPVAVGGTVAAVRQANTTLIFDLQDGSSLTFQTAEPTSCVLLRDKNGVLEYAD